MDIHLFLFFAEEKVKVCKPTARGVLTSAKATVFEMHRNKQPTVRKNHNPPGEEKCLRKEIKLLYSVARYPPYFQQEEEEAATIRDLCGGQGHLTQILSFVKNIWDQNKKWLFLILVLFYLIIKYKIQA